MLSPQTLVAVALGGACGAVSRLVVTQWLGLTLGRGFPWGTLAVNLLGSLLIGLLYGWWSHPGSQVPLAWRAGLVVGFLGALTTMSAFSWDVFELIQKGQLWRAGTYVIVTVVGAFVCTALGALTTMRVFSGA